MQFYVLSNHAFTRIRTFRHKRKHIITNGYDLWNNIIITSCEMTDAVLWVFFFFFMILFLRFCWKSNYFKIFSAGEKVSDIKTLCLEFISKYLSIWQKHLTFKHLTDSSNVNEVMKTVSNFFIFFTRKFYTHKKHETQISE